MVRVRIHYARTQELRYTGNLDMHKVWERFLRRARLPVAYSQGYHPQPKIQQANPLPLGFLGEDEIIDIWLDSDKADLLTIARALNDTGQPGIEIHQLQEVDLTEPAMMTQIRQASYRVILFDPHDQDMIQNQIERILSAAALPRVRRGRQYDLRPLFLSLNLTCSEPLEIEMCLAAREGATGRPEEVLSEMTLNPLAARYIRTRLLTE